LTVYGASSLTDTFEELKTNFEEEHPGTEVQLNFAGSSTLLTQLEQGAPADVFASADEAKMDAAVSDGLAQSPPDLRREPPHRNRPSGQPGGHRELPRPHQTWHYSRACPG